MAYSNVEKQQRYRQRLREQGLVQVQGWVTPEQAAAIRRIMAERAGGLHELQRRREPETGFSQNPA